MVVGSPEFMNHFYLKDSGTVYMVFSSTSCGNTGLESFDLVYAITGMQLICLSVYRMNEFYSSLCQGIPMS